MALYIYLRRNFYRRIRRHICTNIFNSTNNNDDHSKILTIEDSVDDFTTKLMQKKVDKWSTRKCVSKVPLEIKLEDYSNDNVSKLTIGRIDMLFQEAIDVNNYSRILILMQHCLSLRLCPTLSNLLYTLSVYSQSGDDLTVKKIKNLCEEVNPSILNSYSNFQHYTAEALWIKGNIPESLKLFKEVYKENTFLRRIIRLMLKNLIVDIIERRSEAALVNVVNFARELAVEHKDYFPLACIWQTCFLSEWYSDQCVSLDLLDKYEELRKTVITRIPYVVAVSLHNHKTDVVYRLLEVLLKFKMKLQYNGVLLALFNYQIHQKDLSRCVEIIRWSDQNDVQLLPVHYEKFFKLFITNEKKNMVFKKIKPEPKTVTNFKF